MNEGALHGILVTYRRPEELRNTLRRLEMSTQRLDSLLVVDNAPSKDNERAVDDYAVSGNPVEYLGLEENRGPAGAVAEGMKRILESAVDEDWLVLLDDDDPPPTDTALQELRTFATRMVSEDPRTAAVGVAGGRFSWSAARLVRVANEELDDEVPVDYLGSGQCPMYRVGVVRELGPVAEELFFGLEEVDFGLRLRGAGYSIYGNGPLWRHERARLGRIAVNGKPSVRMSGSAWRRYYSLRNLIVILRGAGRTWSALRVTVARGVAKPLLNVLINPRRGFQALSLDLRACRDAWRGELGRTLEPS